MKKTILAMALIVVIGPGVFAADTTKNNSATPQTTTEKTMPLVPLEKSKDSKTVTTTTSTEQSLDCNYKIPADKKDIDSKMVVQWGTKAVQQAFGFDYKTVDEQLKALKNCFTDQGWQGFNDALEKTGNLKAIKELKYTMTNKVDGESRLTEIKDNQWKINIPLQVLYQNDKDKVPQELSIDLLVGRKISGDLGILQMIAAPRASK